jgi:hypothetical protein
MRVSERWARWLALSLPFLLAWGLYAYGLTLPFFADDAPHYRFLQGVDGILPLWLGQTWSPYYRPVVYSVWVVMRTLQGGFDPVWQHAVNVWLFAFAGVFVALLVRRLFGGRVGIAVLAGCAFVTFPFHYQAVNLVGSLTHLAVTFCLLMALLCGIRAYRYQRWGALLACWLWALLANFSHETGFLVAPFLLGTLFLLEGLRLRWREALRVCAVPFALSAGYLVLWVRLPRVGTESGLSLSVSPLDNLGVMLQPFVYPLSALLRTFVEGKGSPLLLLALFGLSVVLGLGVLAWRERGALLRAGAGALWFLVVIAPSVLVLSPSYVWSSPRLAVLASVGAIVFWASVGWTLWRWQAVRPLVQVCLAFWGVLNVSFLLERRHDYELMRDYTHALLAIVLEQDVDQRGLLLVNAPNYIEPLQDDKTFLVGAEFASFMSPEIEYGDYFAVNTARDYRAPSAPIEAVGVGRVIAPLQRQFVPYFPMVDGETLRDLLRVPRPIVVTQFEGERFLPVFVGAGDRPEALPSVRFGDSLALLSASATLNTGTQALQVMSAWQALQPADVKLFVHVLCDGMMVAQADGYVWGNLYPFAWWQVSEAQTDIRTLRLPEGARPECLRVLIGSYREADGVRLQARTWEGDLAFEGDAVPVDVQLLSDYIKP